jgi:HD-GYP domain-containing protein (c-di-GMP phosphodiesterase class II)
MLSIDDKIRRLNRIGIALTSTTKLEELFEMIVTECRSFTNADAGSLFTLEEGKLIFRVAQTESLERKLGYKPPFKAFPLPLSTKSVAGYVALTGEIINVPDCYELDPSKGPVVDRSYDLKMGYRSKSMLAVPMRDDKGEVIGVIQLINAMDQEGEIIPFPEEMVEMMKSIASQAAVALRNARLIAEVKNLFAAFVKYSATAIDERSPHTAGHTRRVAALSMRIAKAINEAQEGTFADLAFSDQQLEELWFAAWLHDIGKIAVKETVLEKSSRLSEDRLNLICSKLVNILMQNENDLLKCTECDARISKSEEYLKAREQIKSDIEFLNKLNKANFLTDESEARLKQITMHNYIEPNGLLKSVIDNYEYKNLSIKRGNLNDEEWREMRSHVVKTRNIVQSIPFTKGLSNVANIAACHHEMIDGSGYPSKIKGEEIPFPSRILAVADVFDALTAPDRPYKDAIPLEKTFSILREEAQKGRLDGRIIELVITQKLYERLKEDQAEYPWKIAVF